MSLGCSSLFFIDCTKSFADTFLSEMQSTIKNALNPPYCVHDLPTTNALSKCFLHLSLSKPFVVQSYLVSSIKREIAKQVKNLVGHFSIAPKKPYFLLLNDSQRRLFVCVNVSESRPVISQIIEKIDAVLCNHTCEPYYTSPAFHISIASIETLTKSVLTYKDVCELESVLLPLLNGLEFHANDVDIDHFTLKTGVNFTQIKI